jgi:hypothetical protein
MPDKPGHGFIENTLDRRYRRARGQFQAQSFAERFPRRNRRGYFPIVATRWFSVATVYDRRLSPRRVSAVIDRRYR